MNELVKASPARLPMARAALARDPENNTQAMISSLRQCGCEAVVKSKTIFPVNPTTGESSGWRDVIDRAEITVSSGANLVRANEIALAALAPAADDDMAIWLAELGLVTARRATGEATSELFLVAYTKRLAAYPGDIVRQTLQGWSGKWFPTWGELKEILDARVAPRLAVRNALLGLTPQKEGRALPSAFESMGPEAQAQWLRKEAEWAIRRSDPDWAAELIERAEEIEDDVRDRMQGQGA